MFKKNERHRQHELLSSVTQLPEKHQQRLENSWAGTFYREFFCQLDETAFAGLYAETPSRPNIPVNVLVGLETLKAGFGWSDEELYDHFLYDLQVRYALGYRQLGEGDFELRSLYNFRQRLSRYNQAHGVNLLEQAFEKITAGQLEKLGVRTDQQRMDATQVASNILDASRLQLLVEALQRLHRILTEADRERLAAVFAPYLLGRAGQYVYRVKGETAYQQHLQQVGQAMHRLLTELGEAYAEEPVFQVFTRFFEDNFVLEAEPVQPKANAALSSGCLQSFDDQEATFRKKGGQAFKGYVANLTETCAPDNPVQLITKLQVAPNNMEEADLLVAALPDLTARTDLEDLHTDGGFGSPDADEALEQHRVSLVQSTLRGNPPDPTRFNLADFAWTYDEDGVPLKLTCPQGQTVPIEKARKNGYLARFDPEICQLCPFHLENRCRAKPRTRTPQFQLNFTRQQVRWAKRRRRHLQARAEKDHRRAAVEASMRSLKHPFPGGKLPVRGLFRMTCLLVASATMVNLRRIWKYEQEKRKKQTTVQKNAAPQALRGSSPLFSSWLRAWLRRFKRPFSTRKPCFSF